MILDDYFAYFDAAVQDPAAVEQLVDLFHEDLVFVVNGKKFEGKQAWREFVQMVFGLNEQLIHMYNGWELQSDGHYQTRWAICGKRFETGVYTQEGLDRAKLQDGKIIYLENQPDDVNFLKN